MDKICFSFIMSNDFIEQYKYMQCLLVLVHMRSESDLAENGCQMSGSDVGYYRLFSFSESDSFPFHLFIATKN